MSEGSHVRPADGAAGDRPLILCIAGSPRRHGNSERLLDACADGANAAGGEARRLIAADAHVSPCRGCNACSSTGECVVRDGMREVYALLDTAKAVAVASPVFFATVPAVLKCLFDRCQPYWARRYVLKQRPPARRPGALLLVRGGVDPFGYGCAVTATKSVFAVLGVDYSAELILEGVDSPSDVGRHPAAIERARTIGAELVAEALRRSSKG